MTAAPATVFDPDWVEAQRRADEAAGEARATARRRLLDRVAQQQATIRAAEADELVAVTEWADLHRADAADDLLGTAAGVYPSRRLACFETCPVDMSGIPVDEYALAELATTLQVADTTARELVEDALELRERLPRTWARILALQVPTWKARALARRSHSLSPQAADYLDQHLAAHLHKLSLGRIKAAVAAAVLRFDPERPRPRRPRPARSAASGSTSSPAPPSATSPHPMAPAASVASLTSRTCWPSRTP